MSSWTFTKPVLKWLRKQLTGTAGKDALYAATKCFKADTALRAPTSGRSPHPRPFLLLLLSLLALYLMTYTFFCTSVQFLLNRNQNGNWNEEKQKDFSISLVSPLETPSNSEHCYQETRQEFLFAQPSIKGCFDFFSFYKKSKDKFI